MSVDSNRELFERSNDCAEAFKALLLGIAGSPKAADNPSILPAAEAAREHLEQLQRDVALLWSLYEGA